MPAQAGVVIQSFWGLWAWLHVLPSALAHGRTPAAALGPAIAVLWHIGVGRCTAPSSAIAQDHMRHRLVAYSSPGAIWAC